MKFAIACLTFIGLGFVVFVGILFLSSLYGFKCEEYKVQNPVCLITSEPGSSGITPLQTGPLTRDVTLNFWGLFIPETVMAPILTEYHQKNPHVTIKYDEKLYEPGDMGFYKDTLKNRLNSKQAPIIFTVNASWMPEISNRISSANASIEVKTYKEKYLPLASSMLVSSQKQSIGAIPYIYDGMAMFYNRDLLAIENLNPPKTWDEARDVALAMTLRDDKTKSVTRYGMAIGNASNVDNHSDIISFMLAQSNIKIPDQLASAQSVTVLKKYVSYQSGDKVWGLDMPNSINAFALNKVAIVFGKVSDLERIMAINPTLNFGVIELPQLPTISGNRTNVGWGTLWANTVSNNYPGDEQKAAWDFLVWLNEDPQLAKLQANVLKYQQIGYVFTNVDFNDKETSKHLKPFINQSKQAKTSYFAGGAGNDQYIKILDEVFSKSSSVSQGELKDAVPKLKKVTTDLQPKVTK